METPMNKFLASAAVAALAFAPIAASAQSALVLDSTKSTGNIEPVMIEPVVTEAPVVVAGPGLGTAGAIALGVGGLLLVGLLLDDDDDAAATTSTVVDGESGVVVNVE
jgi:hypothetical protein